MSSSTTSGLNASIRCKASSPLYTVVASWTDVTTYNSEQNGTVITPASGEVYRLVAVAIQASHDIGYKLSRES